MKFSIEPSKVEGCFIIRNTRFRDERGYFEEVFSSSEFKALGLPEVFRQDNMSVSQLNVIRGLHTQKVNPQGKLLRCVVGSIFDVWADVRPGSSTYGQWDGVELDGSASTAVYIAPGCVHGFQSLTPVAMIYYKCTELYHPGSDGGVRWNDPDFGIQWKAMDREPIVSPKDTALPLLRDYKP